MLQKMYHLSNQKNLLLLLRNNLHWTKQILTERTVPNVFQKFSIWQTKKISCSFSETYIGKQILLELKRKEI